MRDLRLKGVAERLSLRPIRCKECFRGRKPDGSNCAACGGTGRLWSGAGAEALSDARLRRLA